MLAFSPYAGFNFTVIPPKVERHPATGEPLSETAAVRVEFGSFGTEFSYKDPLTGLVTTGAEIHGNYYDTFLAQEQYGWSDDVRETVERCILWMEKKRPHFIRVIEVPVPVVLAPWPTYDDCDYDEVLAIAVPAGLVAESLAYERVNKQRPALVEKLEELLPSDGHEPQNVSVPPREELVPAKGGETRGAITL